MCALRNIREAADASADTFPGLRDSPQTPAKPGLRPEPPEPPPGGFSSKVGGTPDLPVTNSKQLSKPVKQVTGRFGTFSTSAGISHLGDALASENPLVVKALEAVDRARRELDAAVLAIRKLAESAPVGGVSGGSASRPGGRRGPSSRYWGEAVDEVTGAWHSWDGLGALAGIAGCTRPYVSQRIVEAYAEQKGATSPEARGELIREEVPVSFALRDLQVRVFKAG